MLRKISEFNDGAQAALFSETKLAPMNQPSALAPTRPSAAVSPIWAIPTTRVERTSGAMIILIRWRNTVVRIEK